METGDKRFVLACASVSDQGFPVCAVGSCSSALLREGKLGAWLREHPGHWDALLRGEDVLAAQGSSPKGESWEGVRLVPIMDDSRLQGLMLLDIRATGDLPSGSALLSSLGGALLHTVHELEEFREKRAELQLQVERLLSEASEQSEQRLRLENQLREQADSLSRTVHDLRTPLTAVRGFARMLLDPKLELSDTKRHDCLAVILENANRILSLIDRLAVSINSGPPRFGSLNVLELWQECMLLVRPQASRKSIEFVEQLPVEPLMISGDQERLTFVLHKLLSNAVNFTGPGGRIEAALLYGPDKVAVQMQGPADGIPHELIEQAFGCPQNFVQEAPRGVDAETGGASLVHDIVRAHRGRLSVSGGAGQDWNLVLVLPVLQETYCPEAHAKA
jgi:signal transduction histidine kinase